MTWSLVLSNGFWGLQIGRGPSWSTRIKLKKICSRRRAVMSMKSALHAEAERIHRRTRADSLHFMKCDAITETMHMFSERFTIRAQFIRLCIFQAEASWHTNTCWNFQCCIVSRCKSIKICEATDERSIEPIKYIVFSSLLVVFFCWGAYKPNQKMWWTWIWKFFRILCSSMRWLVKQSVCVRACVLFMCTHTCLYYGEYQPYT